MTAKQKDAAISISTGRISTTVLIYILSGFITLGGLLITIKSNCQKIEKLEMRVEKHIEDHKYILESLIRIEENSKFLREVIEEVKKSV
jgi:cell division septal protein FtsQ